MGCHYLMLDSPASGQIIVGQQRHIDRVAEGVVLDYDESGKLVGIDIDNASRKVDLQRFVVSRIPAPVETAG